MPEDVKNLLDDLRARRNAIWDADRISSNWAREHLNDPTLTTRAGIWYGVTLLL